MNKENEKQWYIFSLALIVLLLSFNSYDPSPRQDSPARQSEQEPLSAVYFPKVIMPYLENAFYEAHPWEYQAWALLNKYRF